jgi:hypothetical protein
VLASFWRCAMESMSPKADPKRRRCVAVASFGHRGDPIELGLRSLSIFFLLGRRIYSVLGVAVIVAIFPSGLVSGGVCSGCI